MIAGSQTTIDYEKLALAISEAIKSAMGGTSSVSEASSCTCAAKSGDTIALTAEPAPADNPDASSEPVTKGQGLGDLLRQLRDEKELTNEDLAAAAGIAVSTVGGILAGTTNCPKVGQLQGMARALGVNLSRLVVAAEEDGCEHVEGTEATADDPGQTKADDPEPAQEELSPSQLSDDVLGKQVEALLSGFPGLPEGQDPGIAAWSDYEQLILSTPSAED